MEKRCIFHIPYFIDEKIPSGSNIRPLKIIKALEDLGYTVESVFGYGKKRKEKIKKIKANIENGIKYDFLYSESSTEPTLLTEKNHIPRYFKLDFEFLKYCKIKGIKIGLFYRDIYWKFDIYKENLGFLKRNFAILFYKYDLYKYTKLVDVFYLPSKKMLKYIPITLGMPVEELPPAIDYVSKQEYSIKDKLNIFYVGGISSLYNLEMLFKLVNELKFLTLTVCCRKNEWDGNKEKYSIYLNERVNIIHKSGKELEEYFNKANIFSMLFQPNEYRTFAMPIKLFEYISYKKPILATKDTGAGDFVKENDIGWSIDYSLEETKNLLIRIHDNPKLIYNKVNNISNMINENTWNARGKKIIEDLNS